MNFVKTNSAFVSTGTCFLIDQSVDLVPGFAIDRQCEVREGMCMQ